MGEELKKPKHNIRVGACQVAIWENRAKVKGADVTFLSAQVSRGYKDKNDEWQKTDSFGLNDVPKIILALNKAYDIMAVKETDDKE